MKQIKKQFFIGSLAIMLAALLWSIDGLFIRPKFYILPAELVVFWEHLLGFIVLSPFIFLNWKKIKTLTKKNWRAILWISVFGGVIGTIMITKAFFAAMFGEVTFATVIIIQKLQPFFALLLARLVLKEKLSKQFYVWAGVAIIAGYFIAFGKTGLNVFEIDWFHNAAFFALIAAFAFGSSTVFGKRIANHLDYRAVAALRFGVTSILVFILILINGSFFKFDQITSMQWGLLVVIVFTSGAGAMFFYYFGLRRVSASTATILELFWPFSALILDYVFNKNYLNTIQWVAFLVLLIAFYKVISKGRLKNIEFTATVVHGKGRGEELGFHTANLDKIDLDIPHGVYIVEVNVLDKNYSALMHFGFKDLYNEPVTAEVLIKDFSGDLYGQKIKIKTVRKIRDVKKFSSPDILIKEVKKDLESL